jgi:hypothetical protein
VRRTNERANETEETDGQTKRNETNERKRANACDARGVFFKKIGRSDKVHPFFPFLFHDESRLVDFYRLENSKNQEKEAREKND